MHSIRTMTMADYDLVLELMKQTPGVSFREADSRESSARYLERNPELSFVAENENQIIGCVMCGHDGRRGYLQHLIVLPDFRRNGIANALVKRCLNSLENIGIFKCHIDVFKTNALASAYWESQKWQLRTDINRYSFVRSDRGNV